MVLVCVRRHGGDSDRGRKTLRKLQEEVGVGAEERARGAGCIGSAGAQPAAWAVGAGSWLWALKTPGRPPSAGQGPIHPASSGPWASAILSFLGRPSN